MHARVSTFEGGEPEQIRELVEEVARRAPLGPPEGVSSVGLLLLHNVDEAKVVFVGLFETEEAMRQSGAALDQMEASGDAGERASVEFYEVGAKVDRGAVA